MNHAGSFHAKRAVHRFESWRAVLKSGCQHDLWSNLTATVLGKSFDLRLQVEQGASDRLVAARWT
jgi:hypothetical protein